MAFARICGVGYRCGEVSVVRRMDHGPKEKADAMVVRVTAFQAERGKEIVRPGSLVEHFTRRWSAESPFMCVGGRSAPPNRRREA